MSKRKDVEEYQILFNVTADRDDFYTEDESEYEEMMDELTREGALGDISQCVRKVYIWDEEMEDYVEDEVEILYDSIREEMERPVRNKNVKTIKKKEETAKSDDFNIADIKAIQEYAEVVADKVLEYKENNDNDKVTVDDLINTIDDNINETDIFEIIREEEPELYNKYFNDETAKVLKDVYDYTYYAEEQFLQLVKEKVQARGETVYDEYNESKKITESKKLTEGKYEDTLKDEIEKTTLQYMTDNLGFDEDEAKDYFEVELFNESDTIRIEVRAELNTLGLEDLSDRLNKVVRKYDKEAYFDMVSSGIIDAVIDRNAYNRDKHSKIKADKERYAKEIAEESKKTESTELKPDGGDKTNYFMFYTDNYGVYKDNTADNIAQYGKEHLEGLKDLSLEEIKDKHLYWGTETGFNAFYNGDTYVLFDDIEKLPEDMKKDAYENCKGYSKKTEAEDMSLVKDEVETAVDKAQDITELDIEQIKGSLDVLKTDEESAIAGYEAFIEETKKIVDTELADEIANQIQEIIQDEKDHIEKIETIKTALGKDKEVKTEESNTFGIAEDMYDRTHKDKWHTLSDDEKASYYNRNYKRIKKQADNLDKKEESKKVEAVDEDEKIVKKALHYIEKEYNELGSDDYEFLHSALTKNTTAKNKIKSALHYMEKEYNEIDSDDYEFLHNILAPKTKTTEAVDTEAVKDKVETDIQNQGIEEIVDTENELIDNLKKEVYAYCKQQGLDLEKLRKQGVELESIKDTIDTVVGDMVSKSAIEYMDATNKEILWDFNVDNNDIQIIIQ